MSLIERFLDEDLIIGDMVIERYRDEVIIVVRTNDGRQWLEQKVEVTNGGREETLQYQSPNER